MGKLIAKYRGMPQQVRASLWFVICGFLQKAISLLTTPIFSRLLTTSEYGLFHVYQSWQSILLIFASLNLASGVYLRGLIKYEDDQEEFTASLQSLYLVNCLLVFSVYLLFSPFFNRLFELPTAYVCLIFGDGLFQTAFHFWSARQRVKYRYRALVALTLLNAVLRPTLGVLAVLHCDDKVTARVVTMTLADAAVFGVLFVRMFAHRGRVFSTRYWRYALAYNLPLIPHYLSQIVLNSSDRIMISRMVDSGKAGVYSLAYSAAAILTIVNQSVLNSFNPWMYQSIRDGQYRKIGRVSCLLLLLIAGLNLGLMVCAPEIIAILAPPSYYEAVWVIPPVAMSVYFMFLYSLFANFEFYYEKTQYMMAASVLGAALNIVLNLIFIRRYGFLAAGYTTLACYICYCAAHWALMRHILKKELPGETVYDMRLLLAVSALFVLLGGASLLLYTRPLIRYAVIAALLPAVWLARKRLLGVWKLLASMKTKKGKE